MDGTFDERVEFVFTSSRVPRVIFLSSLGYNVTPGIPPPKRCFTCQCYRHDSYQCRVSRPTSESHRTEECPNKLAPVHCANCGGDHMSTSRLCGIYLYKFEVMKFRFWNNCGFLEAETALNEMGCRHKLQNSKLLEELLYSTDAPRNKSEEFSLISGPYLILLISLKS